MPAFIVSIPSRFSMGQGMGNIYVRADDERSAIDRALLSMTPYERDRLAIDRARVRQIADPERS